MAASVRSLIRQSDVFARPSIAVRYLDISRIQLNFTSDAFL